MPDNVAIYAPTPEVVSPDRLREFAPGARIDAAPGEAGTRLRVAWDDVTVTLNVMPPGEVPGHLRGFAGYVKHLAGGEEGEATRRLLERIAAVRLVYGVVIEPGFGEGGKARELVLRLLQHHGGLLFAADSVYDENAQLLLRPREGPDRAEGEGAKGAEAAWAPTEAQVRRDERARALMLERNIPIYRGPLYVEDDGEVVLREPAEVARRALVLWVVAMRGEGMPRQEALRLIERAGVGDALSRKERAFLDNPEPAPAESGSFVWRLESLWVLLWALGHLDELGWPKGFCDVPRLVAVLRPRETDPTFVTGARLRPAAEVLDAQAVTVRQHWAIRDAWLNKRPVPADLDWSGSAERLAVEACPAVGVVEQRHHTLNWLTRFGGDDWDRIDTPT